MIPLVQQQIVVAEMQRSRGDEANSAAAMPEDDGFAKVLAESQATSPEPAPSAPAEESLSAGDVAPEGEASLPEGMPPLDLPAETASDSAIGGPLAAIRPTATPPEAFPASDGPAESKDEGDADDDPGAILHPDQIAAPPLTQNIPIPAVTAIGALIAETPDPTIPAGEGQTDPGAASSASQPTAQIPAAQQLPLVAQVATELVRTPTAAPVDLGDPSDSPADDKPPSPEEPRSETRNIAPDTRADAGKGQSDTNQSGGDQSGEAETSPSFPSAEMRSDTNANSPPDAFARLVSSQIAAAASAARAGGTGAPRPAGAGTDARLADVRLVGTEGNTLELNLPDAELGQVRMELSRSGDILRVVVAAERTETLELLRRNSETLVADLRQAGLGEASLSFGNWQQGARNTDSYTAAAITDDPIPAQIGTGDGFSTASVIWAPAEGRGRLHIRI